MINFECITGVNIIHRMPAHLQSINPDTRLDDEFSAEYQLVDHALNHYVQCLRSNDLPQLYLASRGLDDQKMIDEFRLGFANRTLGLKLKSLETDLEERARGNLQRLGLLKPSGHEFFHGSIVFPFMSDEGVVVGGYGRRITPKLKSSSVYHVHWNPRDAIFFNQKALTTYRQLILCKSPIEALSFWSHGHTNVVSTLGLRHFNEHHLFALQLHGVNEVLIAFDNNPHGNKAARQVAQILSSCSIHIKRIAFRRGFDANDCVMSTNADQDCFDRLIDKALPLSQTYQGLCKDVRHGN